MHNFVRVQLCHINFYPNFYTYVAHYAFYVACILRGCDMSTVFIRIYGYGYGYGYGLH